MAESPVMKIVACIPSIGLSPYLYDLVDVLLADDVRVRIYANRAEVEFDGDRLAAEVEVLRLPDLTIYQEWNHAAVWAKEAGAYLLLPNDDIVMLPGTAQALAAALDANIDCALMSCGHPTVLVAPSDVRRVSHRTGDRRAFMQWCFMARPEMWQDVDAGYKVWYGDDDLLWKTQEAGHGIGILQGVGVDHYTSTTSVQMPWTAGAAGEDTQLWLRSGH